MGFDRFSVSQVFSASPERIYGDWLSTKGHSAMIGATAEVEHEIGGRISAWGGDLEGTILAFTPNRRIAMTWRANDFPGECLDSHVEILFEPVDGGTLVTITHTDLPEGTGGRYEDGWKKYYFESMKVRYGKAIRGLPPARPKLPPHIEGQATKKGVKKLTQRTASKPTKIKTKAKRKK